MDLLGHVARHEGSEGLCTVLEVDNRERAAGPAEGLVADGGFCFRLVLPLLSQASLRSAIYTREIVSAA